MFNGLWCLHLNTTIAVFSFFGSTQAPFEIKLCNFQVYTSSLSDQTIYLCFNLKIDSMQSISAQLVDNEDRDSMQSIGLQQLNLWTISCCFLSFKKNDIGLQHTWQRPYTSQIYFCRHIICPLNS